MDEIGECELWFYYGIAVGLAFSAVVVVIVMAIFAWWALA
jgi:hypothetical protein